MVTSVVIVPAASFIHAPNLPVVMDAEASVTTITASGSAQNTPAAPAPSPSSRGAWVAVIVTEQRVWVKKGVDAVATVGDTYLMLANDRLELGLRHGERVSIIAEP